jgi:hypothetical protein
VKDDLDRVYERELERRMDLFRTKLLDVQAELDIWRGRYQDLLRMPAVRVSYDVPIGPMLITLQTELMEEGEARDEAERIAEDLQEKLDANAWAPELIAEVCAAVRREHDGDHGDPWAWCERSICKLVRDHELE